VYGEINCDRGHPESDGGVRHEGLLLESNFNDVSVEKSSMLNLVP
jgi:hypothetical protein